MMEMVTDDEIVEMMFGVICTLPMKSQRYPNG